MATHITANYVPDGDDWQITVSTESDQRVERAPGLIAARDKAEQLIEELAPEDNGRVVVHLLNGDAFAFTTAYLQARHGFSDEETARVAANVSGRLASMQQHQ